jgi:hypothetical protein
MVAYDTTNLPTAMLDGLTLALRARPLGECQQLVELLGEAPSLGGSAVIRPLR